MGNGVFIQKKVLTIIACFDIINLSTREEKEMRDFDFDDVKEFVEEHLENAEMWANTRQEVMNSRAIAFGAIMFAQRIELVPYEEIKKYWDD